MRASLTITGIEVELSVPAGALETIAAGRYAPFLGAVGAPVCSLYVEPDAARAAPDRVGSGPVLERQSDAVFLVEYPGFFGRLDLEGAGNLLSSPDAPALEQGLRVLFALLAPRHDGFMLTASGVIGDDGAHVLAGAADYRRATVVGIGGDRRVLIDGYLMVRRVDGTWVVGSTPFRTSSEAPGPPREAKLARLWALERGPATGARLSEAAAVRRAVMDHVYVPSPEPEARQAVIDLVVEMAAAVPSSALLLHPDVDAWDGIGVSLRSDRPIRPPPMPAGRPMPSGGSRSHRNGSRC